jgi:hypothetical protein
MAAPLICKGPLALKPGYSRLRLRHDRPAQAGNIDIRRGENMSIRRLILTSTALAAWSACSAAGQPGVTTSVTRQFTFPVVGIGSTETAEVIVSNQAVNSSNGTAASCTGNVSFTNAGSGASMSSPTNFTLAAGAISHVSVQGVAGSRTYILPAVQQTITNGSARPPCTLEMTLEIYDTTTGATHAVLTLEGVRPVGLGNGRGLGR